MESLNFFGKKGEFGELKSTRSYLESCCIWENFYVNKARKPMPKAWVRQGNPFFGARKPMPKNSGQKFPAIYTIFASC